MRAIKKANAQLKNIVRKEIEKRYCTAEGVMKHREYKCNLCNEYLDPYEVIGHFNNKHKTIYLKTLYEKAKEMGIYREVDEENE